MSRRVLFVDADAIALDALLHAMRHLRGRWEMRVAHDAASAMALLAREDIDAVICDQRVRGLHGPRLLAEIRRCHPQVVRFALSDVTAVDAAMQGLGDAHQLLVRPCEPAMLERAVDRVFALYAQTAHPALRAAIGLLEALPALPRLMRDLLAAIDDADADFDDIARIVERDVSMTARVLQIANSAFFAGGGRVASVRDGIALMGLMPLRGIALSGAFFSAVASLKGAPPLSMARFDMHAQAVGRLAARMLGRTAEARLAFTGGMLHDVGELLIAAGLARQREEILARAARSRCQLIDAEREVLGCTHAELGAQMLALWGLPASLIDIVAHHHAPSAIGAQCFDALGAVHLAEVTITRAAPDAPTVALDAAYFEIPTVQRQAQRWLDRSEETPT